MAGQEIIRVQGLIPPALIGGQSTATVIEPHKLGYS